MSTYKPDLGDVVEVGGMRGIVHAVSLADGKVKVAAGRTDDGVWVNTIDVHLAYRPTTDRPQRNPARVMTKAKRTVGRNVTRHLLDEDAHEVTVELPGKWSLTNFHRRGDNSYAVLKRDE